MQCPGCRQRETSVFAEAHWCGACGALVELNPDAVHLPARHRSELAELVKRMRDAQRAYFRDRSYDNLRSAKLAEQAVDELVSGILGADRQPTLPGM